MKTEYEVKITAEHKIIQDRLQMLGATLLQPSVLMRRVIYDIPGQQDQSCWIRVRDEYNRVLLTIKSFDPEKTIDSLQEMEIEVSDFDAACEMLNFLGYKKSMVIHNYRETWKLDNCLIMLDRWPWLDEFIEIESNHSSEVMFLVEKLNLTENVLCYGTTRLLYQKKYDITQQQFFDQKILTFDVKPTWVV